MSASTGEYLLNEAADWGRWKWAFESRIASEKLIPYVNGDKPFPEEPVLPERPRLPEILMASTATEASPASISTQERMTMRSMARHQTEEFSTQASTTMITGLARMNRPFRDDLQMNEYNLAVQDYNLAFAEFKELRHQYDKIDQSRRDIEKWIDDTVNLEVREQAYDPTADIKAKFKGLEVFFQREIRSIKSDIYDRYLFLTKERTSWPNDLTQWINEWLQTMIQAKQYDIPLASDTSIWARGFFRTFSQVDPHYVTSGQRAMGEEIENGTLTYHKLAMDLRNYYGCIKPGKARFPFDRASFMTKAPKNQKSSNSRDTIDTDEESSPERASKSTKSTKSTKSQKRPFSKTPGQSKRRPGPVCLGCEGVHQTWQCWVLWPELAKTNWTPNPAAKRLAEKNISKPDIRKEVEALQTEFRYLRSLTLMGMKERGIKEENEVNFV